MCAYIGTGNSSVMVLNPFGINEFSVHGCISKCCNVKSFQWLFRVGTEILACFQANCILLTGVLCAYA